MSESPGPGGDADSMNGVKSARRPAEEDTGIEVVPAKAQRVDKDENEDDVALDDEEYEEVDDEDAEGDLDLGEEDEEDGEFEGANEENIFDETGESSTDMEEFIQANLAYIEDCQTDIDSLNQKANDEILKVEQKYNKLRQPVYGRRNMYIEKIPHFWATVFARHAQLRRVLTKEDIKCLEYCTHLQIDDFEDSRSGYSINFTFSENPYFSNKTVTKEYHMPWHETPSCECSNIDWQAGMNLTRNQSSFFSWFCSQDDASSDDIAEIIREELWPNPLQSYMQKEAGVESGSEEESDVDEDSTTQEEAPVYIDDDGAEYISSEDEEDAAEWKGRQVQGKVAPSGGKEDYYIIDDEDDGDFEEGLEDELGQNDASDLGYDVINEKALRDDEKDDDDFDDVDDDAGPSGYVLSADENSKNTDNDDVTNDASNENSADYVTSSHAMPLSKHSDVENAAAPSQDANPSENGEATPGGSDLAASTENT